MKVLTSMYPDTDVSSERRRALAILALRSSLLLQDLEQLRLFSEDGKLDYVGLLETTLRIAEGSSSVCKGHNDDPTCRQVERVSNYLRSHQTELHGVIASATRRDYRGLALKTLDIATKGVQEEECDVNKPPLRHLVTSFVTYALDEETTADSRSISRDAFRAAAIDTLRCSSTGGLDRSAKDAGEAVWHTLLRDVALRASWNQGYRNEVGADGYRTTVTLSGLNLHARFTPRQSSVYAGIEFSVIDWAAPLSELALRKADVDYDQPGFVALDLVRPRLDILAGLPVLSERLAISLGTSWRTITAVRGHKTDSADSPTANAFTYLPFWSGDERLTRGSHAAFIEFNAGVHYVF